LHKEVEAICRGRNDPDGLACSLANQGSLLAFELSRPEEGLPLLEEAAGIATKHGLQALTQQLESTLKEIRDSLPSHLAGRGE
jgi:hypothetical protein